MAEDCLSGMLNCETVTAVTAIKRVLKQDTSKMRFRQLDDRNLILAHQMCSTHVDMLLAREHMCKSWTGVQDRRNIYWRQQMRANRDLEPPTSCGNSASRSRQGNKLTQISSGQGAARITVYGGDGGVDYGAADSVSPPSSRLPPSPPLLFLCCCVSLLLCRRQTKT